jgi:hypothetical protein
MKDCPICQTAPIHTFDDVEAWKAHAKEAHPAIYQSLVAGTPTRPTLPTRPRDYCDPVLGVDIHPAAE